MNKNIIGLPDVVFVVKEFADFPVGRYKLETDMEDPYCGYYVNDLYGRPPRRDGIHPDIVNGMKQYFKLD